MSWYLILGEDDHRDTPVLRKLASFPADVSEETIKEVFNAIVDGGAFEKLYLVEVVAEG